MSTAPLISVVVCTYQRPDLIAAYFPSICQQTLSTKDFEIIVIDNNSQDGTAGLIKQFMQQHDNIHYYLEPKTGLSHARNCGWKAARGRYIAYLDDDCKVPSDWLVIAKDIIETHAPVEFGGPPLAFFSVPKPQWWLDDYDLQHSHFYAEQAGYLSVRQEIYGCNLFLVRDAIEQAGGFDPEFGMTGNKIAYGEEWELHRRLVEQNPEHRAYYDPRLYVYHLVRPEQLSLLWTLRERVSRGHYTHLISCHGQAIFSFSQSIWFPALFITQLIKLIASSLWHRDQQQHPHWQNVIYEDTTLQGYCAQLGQLFSQWRTRPRYLVKSGPMTCVRCTGAENIPDNYD